MKDLLFVLSIFVVAVCIQCQMPPDESRQQAIQDCKKELGVTEEKMSPEDPKRNCVMACVMKKTGKMVEGKIILEKVMECFKKRPNVTEAMETVVAECVSKANEIEGDCEKVGFRLACMKEKLNKEFKME